MFLTLSAPISGADLGYLLLKNPSRFHSFELPFGNAHVFYPELGEHAAQACLLLDLDPVGLVRGRRHGSGEGGLDQYVNDRPYVASSFLSVALSRVFGTAMGGRSKERPELAAQPLDWSAEIGVAPCPTGDLLIRSLFEPLGYRVETQRHGLDERFPEWGEGIHFTIRLRGRQRLQDLLSHVYVLVPALDAAKHYWVGDDEVEKLLRKGEGWLPAHPAKDLIARRYLRNDRRLVNEALARLAEEDVSDDPDQPEEDQQIDEPLRLWEQRIAGVLAELRAAEARTVVDLGCGEGKLLKPLLQDRSFERVLGMDVSWRSLEIARRRLRFDQMPDAQLHRIELIHGSLMYRDKRLEGFDAATAIEVIEHLDPPRLAAFERVLFECAQPKTVIITTPNAGYNVKFETLPAGRFRHKDHRFEWTRAEFAGWAGRIGERFGYQWRLAPVGVEDPAAGAPTQMGVFTR